MLKESEKNIVTMQGLRMLTKDIERMKELGVYESTIKRRQLKTDGYLSRKEGSGRNRLTD